MMSTPSKASTIYLFVFEIPGNYLLAGKPNEMVTGMNALSRTPRPILENIKPPCKFDPKNAFFERVLWQTYVHSRFMVSV